MSCEDICPTISAYAPEKTERNSRQQISNNVNNCLSKFDHFVGLMLKGLVTHTDTAILH